MTAPWPWRIIAVILLLNGAFLLWTLSAPGTPEQRALVSDVWQIVGTVLLLPWLGVPLALLRSRRAQPVCGAPSLRPSAAWLSAAAVCDALGSVVWWFDNTVRGAPAFPSGADAFWLAAYPCLLLGTFRLPVGTPMGGPAAVSRWRVLLDAVMITTTAATFTWYIVLGPLLFQADVLPLAKVVNAAYPIADLLLVVSLLRLPSLAPTAALAPLRRATRVLTVALLLMLVTDSVYLWQTMHDAYHSGGLLDVMWPFIWMLVALAIRLLQRVPAAPGPEAGTPVSLEGASVAMASPQAPPLWRMLLPYTVVPAVGGLALWTLRTRWTPVAPPVPGSPAIPGFSGWPEPGGIAGIPGMPERPAVPGALDGAHDWLRPPGALSALAGDPWIDSGVYVGAGLLIGVVLLHQGLSLLEQRGLYRRLRTAYAALEQAHVQLVADGQALATANARLQALATTDPLTELANHRAVVAALDQELARCRRLARPCAVLFLDLDHFKAVNDSYGHAVGDATLREFAAVLRATARGPELVGRWGGEEFVVLLSDADGPMAATVAERFRSAVAQHAFTAGGGMRLTCSIGIAAFPADARGRDELVQAADRAMYAAKQGGRNQVRQATEYLTIAIGTAGIESSPGIGDAGGPIMATEWEGAGAAGAPTMPAARDALRVPRVSSVPAASRGDAALAGTVEALMALIGAHDRSLRDHGERVATLAMRLVLAMGYDAALAHVVGIAARLHDVGTIAVPVAILAKPASLNAEERARVREHPRLGADVVAQIPALRMLAPMVAAHHERWDGHGYPDGLAGQAIPLGARVLAVADAYDSLTAGRAYRGAVGADEALARLESAAGTQFDPAVVAALARVLTPAQHELALV